MLYFEFIRHVHFTPLIAGHARTHSGVSLTCNQQRLRASYTRSMLITPVSHTHTNLQKRLNSNDHDHGRSHYFTTDCMIMGVGERAGVRACVCVHVRACVCVCKCVFLMIFSRIAVIRNIMFLIARRWMYINATHRGIDC